MHNPGRFLPMARTDPRAPTEGIAVFGSSAAEPGDLAWARAESIGSRVARAGLPLVCGGYGGVMEAACKGAREAGGETIGVTCRVFEGRRPNRYLTLEIEEADLAGRTRRLILLARGFVVLAGAAGTLAELATLWAWRRAGVLAAPVVILDDLWETMARDLADVGRLEPRVLETTRFARDPAEAVRLALGEE